LLGGYFFSQIGEDFFRCFINQLLAPFGTGQSSGIGTSQHDTAAHASACG